MDLGYESWVRGRDRLGVGVDQARIRRWMLYGSQTFRSSTFPEFVGGV